MPGYVTLIAAITGLGGLQMLMLGVIGEYIGRIYYETKKRPHYLLKQTNMDPANRLEKPPAPGGRATRGR
jgi:polyisoprenyl-phosphate glycosyltransferase